MHEPPLISLSNLKREKDEKYVALCHEIGQAAQDIGFLRICDHGIDLDLIEATYQQAKRFFSMPEEFKSQYYIGKSINHRGYVPFNEKGDYPDEKNRCYEAYDLGLDLPHTDPDYLAGNRILGPNVWPELLGFKSVVGEYYRQVSALGRRLCGCLETHLGLPDAAITSKMSKPVSQLRLLHYVREAQATDPRSVNMGAHTDYECLTLLHTRNEGLQAMTRDDTWVDVPVDPATLIVNVGDMLEAWTNGILRSTPHRVLNLSPERFSLPYFVAANHDAEIRPFQQLLRDDEMPKYQPIFAGEHLERMLMRDFPYFRRSKSIVCNSHGLHLASAQALNPFETRLHGKVA
ncbi:isopenicillin N synthase family oxygenase [Poseidonocella sp. HB161398]|uniref:isopenicillin N synthase family dioxygenase n=1 Tax=Poseidonocella sp. HB161398 TaxID=2320855 RepID=UPI001109D592|nr:2-oxoglutarate and iron-dependent oxygenase domain-containing protein [Poseidonocella sp. HB161398]